MQPDTEIMKIKTTAAKAVNRCLLHSATMIVDAMLTLPKKPQKARRDVAECRNSETCKMLAEADVQKSNKKRRQKR